jgi:hypothetical protein
MEYGSIGSQFMPGLKNLKCFGSCTASSYKIFDSANISRPGLRANGIMAGVHPLTGFPVGCIIDKKISFLLEP